MSIKMPKGKFIATVTVGDKGQIVIPKGARDLFEILPGDTLVLMADKKRGIAIVPSAPYLDLAQTVFAAEAQNSRPAAPPAQGAAGEKAKERGDDDDGAQ